jgi:DNA polymerase
MTPDYRKSLTVLRQEWETCTACNLGQVRQETGGAFVFGEGAQGAIMFIGEGPGREENEEGRPFIGKSGRFLRTVLEAIGIKHFYITNAVCCRSFIYQLDGEGRQKFVTRKGVSLPVEQDEAPNTVQRAACLPRLQQEIYAVDPILIVTLGATAAEAVLGRSLKVLQESGELKPDMVGAPGTVLKLPGAGHRAQLTPKGVWRHKVRGEYIMPTQQSVVEYPVVPLLHPAYVLRCFSDKSTGSPKEKFASGLSAVKRYYASYMQTVYGEVVAPETVSASQLDGAAGEEEW